MLRWLWVPMFFSYTFAFGSSPYDGEVNEAIEAARVYLAEAKEDDVVCICESEADWFECRMLQSLDEVTVKACQEFIVKQKDAILKQINEGIQISWDQGVSTPNHLRLDKSTWSTFDATRKMFEVSKGLVQMVGEKDQKTTDAVAAELALESRITMAGDGLRFLSEIPKAYYRFRYDLLLGGSQIDGSSRTQISSNHSFVHLGFNWYPTRQLGLALGLFSMDSVHDYRKVKYTHELYGWDAGATYYFRLTPSVKGYFSQVHMNLKLGAIWVDEICKAEDGYLEHEETKSYTAPSLDVQVLFPIRFGLWFNGGLKLIHAPVEFRTFAYKRNDPFFTTYLGVSYAH
jgi:hypothetical protein